MNQHEYSYSISGVPTIFYKFGDSQTRVIKTQHIAKHIVSIIVIAFNIYYENTEGTDTYLDHKDKIIQGKERRSLWSLLTLFLTGQGTQISLYLSREKCSNMTGTFSLANYSSALRSFVRNWAHSIFGRRKADVNKSYIMWTSNQEF